MKKISILLIALLAISFTACGTKNEVVPGKVETPVETPVKTPAEEPVKTPDDKTPADEVSTTIEMVDLVKTTPGELNATDLQKGDVLVKMFMNTLFNYEEMVGDAKKEDLKILSHPETVKGFEDLVDNLIAKYDSVVMKDVATKTSERYNVTDIPGSETALKYEITVSTEDNIDGLLVHDIEVWVVKIKDELKVYTYRITNTN